MLPLFLVSLFVALQKRSSQKLKLLVELSSKDTFHSEHDEYHHLLSDKYTDLETTSCLVLVPAGKPNTFLARIGRKVSNGKVHESIPVKLPVNVAFCANYAIGPHENFIRMDENVTNVSDKESVDGHMVLNSTHILSGHHIITRDIKVGECGGEMRFTCSEHVQEGSIIRIDHFNFQSSVYDYPDILALNTTDRFDIDANLLKTNEWEIKGRRNKKKYLKK